MPKRDKFFILPVHIKCILQLPLGTLKHLRGAGIIVLGTLCVMRATEVARLDVCDLLWDYDGAETLALLLWYRKNDGFKRGLPPRIGKGSTAATCPQAVVHDGRPVRLVAGYFETRRQGVALWKAQGPNGC